jgi:cyclophilin family peptidyl-prolyl cis-trans isomerase
VRLRFLPAVGLLLLLPLAARAEQPRLSDERVVVQTDAGDIVFAFYPDVAPEHVKQILHLVRLGCYDHTVFFRVEPGYVIQLGEVQYYRDTNYPLTEAQLKALHPLPAEFSKTLKHRRGILTMARHDGKPDSATTSFSIVLGNGPLPNVSGLDGQYTIFGEVVHGMDVVDKLTLVPPLFIDPLSAPLPMIPLDVEKMEVVLAKDLDLSKLSPAHDVQIPQDKTLRAHVEAWKAHRNAVDQSKSTGTSTFGFETTYLLTGGVLLVILLALTSFVGAGRLNLRWLVSLNMLIVLVGAFLLLVLLTPYAQAKWPLAIIVFVSFCGLFKLLSRFESVG